MAIRKDNNMTLKKKDKFLRCFEACALKEDLPPYSEISNCFLNKVALLANKKYKLNWTALPENQEAWFAALEQFKKMS